MQFFEFLQKYCKNISNKYRKIKYQMIFYFTIAFFIYYCIINLTGLPAPLNDVTQGRHFFNYIIKVKPMNNYKKATSYKEQAEILKRHGCQIDDENFCLEKLSYINYYRLTAYLLPFKKNNNEYLPGTNFNDIYQIYEFDRYLRSLIFNAIEVIEISLRTKLSYYHAHKYGSLGYLDSNNFSNNHNAVRFKNNIAVEIKRNKDVLFVKHHLTKYGGNFPTWVITELFSFGMISYFYSDLKTQDKKQIAAEYGLNYKDLASWLRCLTDLRNICAHYGRLYYRVFSASPASLNLPESQKRRLWGIILVMKHVYPNEDKWNCEFLPLLCKLFDEYKNYINLYHLAFPNDWTEQLKK